MSRRIRPSYLGAVACAGLAVSLLSASTTATVAVGKTCSVRTSILKSPRVRSREVQAKALNDRGDVVGFADRKGGSGPVHAILWKRGRVKRAVDLGVPGGYVASEAYGVNNDRVVFGLLYDKKERTFPFRWKNGHFTVLKDPNGRKQQADVPDRNTINDSGQMVATLIIAGQRQAVRWASDGKATLLPSLPGHTWTDAFSINSDGVVSGWSRRLPNEDGEENPVLWDPSGSSVVPLQTVPGRADGIAEATNRSGLTVGYLGNLGTEGIPGVPNTDPERDNAVVWQSRAASPGLLGPPAPPHGYGELVDVNESGEAAGMSGSFTKTLFVLAKPVIWKPGFTSLKRLPIPAASRKSRVVVTALNDINNRGKIVGDVYGLAGKDYSKLHRIDPVVWTCAFGR